LFTYSFFQKIIESQVIQNKLAEKSKSGDIKNSKLSSTQYHTLDGNVTTYVSSSCQFSSKVNVVLYTISDIYAYLEHLQDKFENLVEVITIGKSSEGRELQVIRISTTDSSNGSIKPAIWIDAGAYFE